MQSNEHSPDPVTPDVSTSLDSFVRTARAQERDYLMRVTIVASGLWFGGCCFAVMPLMSVIDKSEPPALIVFACIGSILALCGGVAMTVVLGPGRAWQRIVVAYGLFVIFAGSWLLGEIIGRQFNDTLEAAARAVLVVPVMVVAASLPLWCLRLLGFRLELTRDSLPLSSAAPQLPHMRVPDLVAITAGAAVSLGLARYAKLRGLPDPYFWIPLLVGVGVSFVVGIVFLTVIVLLFLRCRTIMTAALGTAGLTVVTIVVTAMSLGITLSLTSFQLLCAATVISSFMLGLAIPAWMTRLAGYRLVWGHERPAEAVADYSQRSPSPAR